MKDKKIVVRVSETEHTKIKQTAKKQNCTISNLLLSPVLNQDKKIKKGVKA